MWTRGRRLVWVAGPPRVRVWPVSMLRISKLSFVDSNIRGNSLWAWEFHPLRLRCLYIYMYIYIYIYIYIYTCYSYICIYIYIYIQLLILLVLVLPEPSPLKSRSLAWRLAVDYTILHNIILHHTYTHLII